MRGAYTTGLSRTGDKEFVAGPSSAVFNPGTVRPVVFCHAAGHVASTMLNANSRPEAWKLTKELVKRWPTIISDQAGDSWANNVGIASVEGCVNHIRSINSTVRASDDPVLLVGVSMGFAVACAWARTHISDVAGIVGILPATDLGGLYTRNYGTSVDALNAAYSGFYDVSVDGPTHDPMMFADELSVPIQLYYGNDDPAAIPSSILAFAALAPNCIVSNLGNLGGHDTEAAYQPSLDAGLIDFLVDRDG